MFFLSLEKSEIPELWDLFHLWHFSYLVWDRRLEERVAKGPRWFNIDFILHSMHALERQQSPK